MPKFHSKLQAYLAMVAGLLLFILGLIVLFNESATRNTTVWLPALLILAGIFVLPSGSESKSSDASQKSRSASTATLVASTLLLTGVYLLLRDFGLISIPILRYVLGIGFLAIGLYGVIGGWMSATTPKESVDKLP